MKVRVYNVIVAFDAANVEAHTALGWGACHLRGQPIQGEVNGVLTKLVTYQFDSPRQRDTFVERVNKSSRDPSVYEFEYEDAWTYRQTGFT